LANVQTDQFSHRGIARIFTPEGKGGAAASSSSVMFPLRRGSNLGPI